MGTGKIVAAVALLAVVGVGVYLAGAGDEPAPGDDAAVEISTRPSVSPTPEVPRLPEVEPVELHAPLPAVQPDLARRLDSFLYRFDGIWASPLEAASHEKRAMMDERDRQTIALAEELAAFGADMLPAIDARFTEPLMTYPRQMFLARALSAMGTTDSLAVLARALGGEEPWRLQNFAMQQIVAADVEVALPVVVSSAPKMTDARLIAEIFKSSWKHEEIELAYRTWASEVTSTLRNQSYVALYRPEGEWIDVYLRQIAAGEYPSPERAGAINALSQRNPDGILDFFADLLWKETDDEAVIKTLLAAIRNVGGDEGLRILAEYAESQAPDKLRAYALAVLSAPDKGDRVMKIDEVEGVSIQARRSDLPPNEEILKRQD